MMMSDSRSRSRTNAGEVLTPCEQMSITFKSAAFGAGQAAADGQKTYLGSVFTRAAFAAPASK
jgi:hypothetical protein